MCVARHAQITQNHKIGIFLKYLKEKKSEVDFLQADNRESFLQIDTMIFDGYGRAFPKFPKCKVCIVFKISRKRSYRREVEFLDADRNQNFRQFDFNALIIKVSLMMILPLLIGMIKHF